MVIKQIFMVATAHPLANEKAVTAAFKKAEQEMDEAIKEGYTLFAHYPVNANHLTGQMFVMHKMDEPRQLTSTLQEDIDHIVDQVRYIQEDIEQVCKEHRDVSLAAAIDRLGEIRDTANEMRKRKGA